MFFCDACAERNGWTPVTVPVMGVIPDWVRSFGQCELCHISRPCWDIPSGALPYRPVYMIPETP